ncbi:transposase [Thermodesulfobacterium hydrogeniphilum]|uniref:transposase n=1 Tax=Thermodesulfobacterium hydrogeniphilum TaxID=161156 RepID=UPI00056EA8AC|nr:transposase [Thermodesulfobacterium hydrogeniphilum]
MEEGKIYHVYTKSIAGFKIFLNDADYRRILKLLRFYQFNPKIKFSYYERLKNKIKNYYNQSKSKNPLVNIIAYCIMPTHIHLVLEELSEMGISEYMRKVLDSYTRYFNKKIKRKGPLWEGRIKKVPVLSDEQLLHLTRYVHLNPTSAGLVEKPEDWKYSSYREYIGLEDKRICIINKFFDFSKKEYKKFVEDRIDYQRSLEIIKHLILEDL